MIKKNKPLDCDILVIGGGTAGMMAAIYGAQAGADVILAEKANTRRSGAGATGNDHFQCYIPEIHGSEQEFMNLFMHDRPGGKGKDMNLNVAFMRGSFDVVQDWERWGIPMRPHGFWEFTGHTLPWIQGTHLKYAGVNQKPAFTKEALRCGVRILNRHPAVDLITNENGAICGAVLVDLTENVPKMLVINCKAVILCTARGGFLNGSERMGCIFNSASCYTNTGDGSAMAWKVGARILGYGVSGEMSSGGIGASRYFVRGGTRTWVGTYTDLYGHTWAPFGQETNYDVLNPKYPGEAHIITYPDYKTGDYTQYLPENKMKDAYAKGKTVFMSFAFNNQEDTDYMKWALVHEGNGATLSHLDDEGFDFKKHMLEFKSEMSGGAYCGGPDVTERGETTISGLYAAGECTGNRLPGLSPAAVMGRDAGRAAAEYAKHNTLCDASGRPEAQSCQARLERLLDNPVGTAAPTYQEANVAIMQTVWDYGASGVCSEELFYVGLQHIRRLRKKIEELRVQNVHELMNSISVQNIALNAELALMAGQNRRESRPGSNKFDGACKNYVDYPEIDHQYDNAYFSMQLNDGIPTYDARKVITEFDGFTA